MIIRDCWKAGVSQSCDVVEMEVTLLSVVPTICVRYDVLGAVSMTYNLLWNYDALYCGRWLPTFRYSEEIFLLTFHNTSCDIKEDYNRGI
jgi:hypothetical protein